MDLACLGHPRLTFLWFCIYKIYHLLRFFSFWRLFNATSLVSCLRFDTSPKVGGPKSAMVKWCVVVSVWCFVLSEGQQGAKSLSGPTNLGTSSDLSASFLESSESLKIFDLFLISDSFEGTVFCLQVFAGSDAGHIGTADPARHCILAFRLRVVLLENPVGSCDATPLKLEEPCLFVSLFVVVERGHIWLLAVCRLFRVLGTVQPCRIFILIFGCFSPLPLLVLRWPGLSDVANL